MPSVPLDDMYRDVVLDHYRSPRGKKKLAHCDCRNEGQNPVCGDEISLCLALDGEKITDVAADCRGCSISVASASMMAELLPGKSIPETRRLLDSFKGMMHGTPAPADLDIGDLDALEGVQKFPVRVKCALLAWTTLEAALTDREGSASGRQSHCEGKE
jgi:nitrogen fixation NifU-like protein